MVSTEELSKVGLFSDLNEDQLLRISHTCEFVEFNKGALVFHEGGRAERFYILVEGRAVIQIQLSTRPTKVSVGVINQPYQTLGWSCIVPPHYYTASAMCERDCRFIAVEGKSFTEILKRDPEASVLVYMRIAELISNRLRNSRAVLLKSL